ncbi:MAG: hypothetical protein GY811_14435 [Myxococcales bacterium]|nr:hypothetical protein [Myxococcales bacterium]
MSLYRSIAVALLSLSTLLVALPEDADAYPVYRRYFQDHYGKATRCEGCHEYGGSSNRNAFGKAFQEAGEAPSDFAQLDEIDSDGDGASNLAEATAGSNPGDQRSTPESMGRLWKRALRTIPVPREQLALVMGDSTSLGLMEAEMSEEQVELVREGSGVTAHALDAHPTLYFGSQDGTRQRVAMFRHFRSKHGLFSLLFSVSASGTLERAVLFRAGQHSTGDYREFLACFTGATQDSIPKAGIGACPAAGSRAREMRMISEAVVTGMWTLNVLLSAETTQEATAEPDKVAGHKEPKQAKSNSEQATGGTQAGFNLMNAATTQSVSLEKAPSQYPLTLAAMALLLALIVGSVRLALRSPGAGAELPKLHTLPSSAKLLAGLVFMSLLCVHIVAAITIVYQTSEVHSSVMEYFEYMSYARLLGLSHSHIFGFAMMYSAIGLLVCMTDRSEFVKCGLIATILWCGIFDVASWWGMKHLSESFHLLSYMSGGASGIASTVAIIIVALGLRAPRTAG